MRQGGDGWTANRQDVPEPPFSVCSAWVGLSQTEAFQLNVTVTGLLLSYRFSSAVAKWDEGKKVWVDVRVAIRDGMRTVGLVQRI